MQTLLSIFCLCPLFALSLAYCAGAFTYGAWSVNKANKRVKAARKSATHTQAARNVISGRGFWGK